MGVVYRARDRRRGRAVALKLPHPDLAPGVAASFAGEAHAVAELDHAGIVRVLAWGWHEGAPYVAMELVEGPTLKDLERAGPLAEPVALRIAAQIADALEAAHRRGILHRDVKPRNVLVDRDGRPRLTDFGVGCVPGDGPSEADTVLGSARYIAPEAARGATTDARSDLYSLGALLYELLVGQPPFVGGSAETIAERHAYEPPEPPRRRRPAISPAAEAVVLRALEQDSARRFASAAEIPTARRRRWARSPRGSDGDPPRRPRCPRGRRSTAARRRMARG